MRFMLGLFVGGAVAFGGGLLAWPDPPPEASDFGGREYAKLLADKHEEAVRRIAAERRAVLWQFMAAIWRGRCLELGQPQSWPGKTVSTPVVVPPPEELGIFLDGERIPAPPRPFPLLPKE